MSKFLNKLIENMSVYQDLDVLGYIDVKDKNRHKIDDSSKYLIEPLIETLDDMNTKDVRDTAEIEDLKKAVYEDRDIKKATNNLVKILSKLGYKDDEIKVSNIEGKLIRVSINKNKIGSKDIKLKSFRMPNINSYINLDAIQGNMYQDENNIEIYFSMKLYKDFNSFNDEPQYTNIIIRNSQLSDEVKRYIKLVRDRIKGVKGHTNSIVYPKYNKVSTDYVLKLTKEELITMYVEVNNLTDEEKAYEYKYGKLIDIKKIPSDVKCYVKNGAYDIYIIQIDGVKYIVLPYSVENFEDYLQGNKKRYWLGDITYLTNIEKEYLLTKNNL